MGRWILVYQGKSPIPAEAEQAVRSLPAEVIDRAGRSILVEGDGRELRPAVEKLDDWTITPEKHAIRKPPPPRPRVKRKPDSQ
jgi:hypothetical protein